MSVFEMTIKGGRDLAKAARQYPEISRPIIQRALVGTQAVFAKHTLKDNPVPYKLGGLLASFRFRANSTTARWFPTAHYARMVEEGTRPHTIVPKTRRVLSWKTGSGGRYVTSASGRRRYQSGSAGRAFAMKVNHPGTKPRPYMQAILDNSKSDIERLFRQATEKIIASITGRV